MKERNRLNETFDLDAMLKILLLWTIFWNSHIISSDTDNFVVCIIQYLARQKYQCKQQQMWRRNIQAKAEIPHSQQILGIFPLLALQLLLPTNVLTDLDCNRWSKIRSFISLFSVRNTGIGIEGLVIKTVMDRKNLNLFNPN